MPRIPLICLYTPGGCCIDIEAVFFLVSILTVTSNNNNDDGNDAKNDWKCHISKLRVIDLLFAIQTFFAGISNKPRHTLNAHFLHHPCSVTFYCALA